MPTATIEADLQEETPLGKFILGFIVAIVVVLFVVARCVGALV